MDSLVLSMWLIRYLYVSFSTEQLSKLAPSDCPHLVLQAMAGPLAAATASTVTNPMDVVRARVQVNFHLSDRELWMQC